MELFCVYSSVLSFVFRICLVFYKILLQCRILRQGVGGGFSEQESLTGVEAALAGQDEANDAHQAKQVQVRTAEHLNAEDDGGEGRVGGTAEQADETQGTAQTRIQPQETAHNTAKGSANAEGGNDFAALKAGSQSDGRKEHF